MQGGDDLFDNVGWKPPSRQVAGRKTERDILKDVGARAHPNSGAGKIKYDGSDDEAVYEVKDMSKSFTLVAADLFASFVHASRQGKRMVWLVYFRKYDITAVIEIKRGRKTPL